ncbi:MAG: AMP-binding protein, partial [Pseudobdellovibrio sp.]
ILRAGLVAVPINVKLSNKQVHSILEQSNCILVFSDLEAENYFSDSLEIVRFGLAFDNFLIPGTFESIFPSDTESALILYTSGSTTQPKGVVLSHKNFGWKISATAKEIINVVSANNFIHFVLGPLCHMNGLSSAEVILAAYGTILISPDFDPIVFAKALEKYKVASFSCVPTMLAMLFEATDTSQYDLSSVKFINCASAPLTDKLLAQIKKYFPNPVCKIQNNYGLTEVGPRLFGRHPLGIPTPDLSVGFPIPGIDYRIINEILQIRSPSIMVGFHKPIENSLTPDGYYITNDLFRIDENGFYFFVGRADDMFVCGGQNIFPSSIECALEQNPSVALAFVISLPDSIKGEKPYAFVILNKFAKTSEEDLKIFLQRELPYNAQPRRIWRLAQIHLSGTNKIDKKFLKILAQQNLNSVTTEFNCPF